MHAPKTKSSANVIYPYYYFQPQLSLDLPNIRAIILPLGSEFLHPHWQVGLNYLSGPFLH